MFTHYPSIKKLKLIKIKTVHRLLRLSSFIFTSLTTTWRLHYLCLFLHNTHMVFCFVSLQFLFVCFTDRAISDFHCFVLHVLYLIIWRCIIVLYISFTLSLFSSVQNINPSICYTLFPNHSNISLLLFSFVIIFSC